MLWKLFSSDEKVMQALEQSDTGYDLSPDASLHMAANNDAPAQPVASTRTPSRLWLEGWNEQDEARVKGGYFWESHAG